ncbi:hypothetical protein NLJ89_g5790 [Agrocybe chaxingu]|uniref:Uncharacterized protein n=1 Tax=Agrocybe chaxingu TaxID=84603 RepID=A0A9W8MX09_9AGAR|nr:hypothetical protein NLJ89_g5790 [Agrocybe chaxingu]
MQHIQPAPSNVILKCTPMKLLDISWDQVMTMEILGCDLPDCLDVLRSVPGMTQLKFNCINIDDFLSGAQPATHGSLRSLKITETSLTDLLPLLILPDLQELFVDYTSLFIDYTSLASEVTDFVKQSGCQLTRLTIEFSYEKNTEDTERYIITLLEYIPTLQDLRLADVHLTDVFFQRLKPANSTATSGSTSLEAPTGTFLPALHTLFIDCAKNFSWLSVCDIFIPASRYSSPSVKVFRLVISSDTSWGSGKVSIDRSAADFLISARKRFNAQITVVCEGIDMLSAIEAEEDAK